MRYFGYLGGADDDQRALRRAVRRPAARARESEITRREMDLAALDPGGHRGDRAAHGPPRRASSPASATPAWPAAWPSTAWPTAGCCARASSTTSGSSPRPATPAAPRRRAVRLAPDAAATRARPRARRDGMQRRVPRAASSPTTRSRRASTSHGYPYRALAERGAGPRSPSCWPTGRWSACSRAGWSSARGRSGTARSSATRARPRCSR